jgi:hypothetical protein
MDLTYYDFESGLEQGFKTLLAAANIELRIADDYAQGDLHDEFVTLEIDAGAPISDRHQNNSGVYDHYSGSISIEVQTPLASSDQTITAPTRDEYNVAGAGTAATNGVYVRNGNSENGKAAYTQYDTDGTTALYHIWSLTNLFWYITSTAIDEDPATILYFVPNGDATPPESGWLVIGDAPAPAVTASTIPAFRSRHSQLVATVRKTLEEIDAALLAKHWPGELSPTQIIPTGTERSHEDQQRMTALSYSIQFRIA